MSGCAETQVSGAQLNPNATCGPMCNHPPAQRAHSALTHAHCADFCRVDPPPGALVESVCSRSTASQTVAVSRATNTLYRRGGAPAKSAVRMHRLKEGGGEGGALVALHNTDPELQSDRG